MKSSFRDRAFTLIEVLVACAVMALLLTLLLTITTQVSDTWRRTATKMQAFEAARSAFDTITSNLAQATLNTYWDYDQPQTPTKYERRSELHFLSGPTSQVAPGLSANNNPGHAVFFQAPTGAVAVNTFANLPYLLNGWGYFVEFGSDEDQIPTFLRTSTQGKYRFRLKEWRIPSEKLSVYFYTSGQPNASSSDWINLSDSGGSLPQTLAENVILLLMIPRMPTNAGIPGQMLANSAFVYNSRTGTSSSFQKNQLPPAMEVIMVAIDEASAQRLADKSGTARPNIIPAGQNFSTPTSLESDLEGLKESLETENIRYILLRSIVTMRAGRWSHGS